MGVRTHNTIKSQSRRQGHFCGAPSFHFCAEIFLHPQVAKTLETSQETSRHQKLRIPQACSVNGPRKWLESAFCLPLSDIHPQVLSAPAANRQVCLLPHVNMRSFLKNLSFLRFHCLGCLSSSYQYRANHGSDAEKRTFQLLFY